MAAYNLFSVIVSAIAMGCCLPCSAERQGRSLAFPVREIFPPCEERSEPRFLSVKRSVISQAMTGVDPLAFDLHGKRNFGLKDQIFNGMSPAADSPNAFQLKDFIGKADLEERCPSLSLLSFRTLNNYNSYRDALGESLSFETEDNINVGVRRSCASLHSGLNSGVDDEEEEKLVKFFSSGGEMQLGELECQTHVVSINLNTFPTFTDAFQTDLGKIKRATEDSLRSRSRSSFLEFVKNFGTHFQARTYYGSRLLVKKLFAKKAATPSENIERRRCVSSSFTRNLLASSSFEDVIQRFNSDVSLCADSDRAPEIFNSLGLSSTRILTVGTVPWPDRSRTHERPVPIHYRLEKISKIFQKDWFDLLQCSLDGTVMETFFEDMTSEYHNTSTEASCAAPRKVGCGYDSKCNFEEICIEDSTTKEGFSCRKPCTITGICPVNTICVNDDSLENFSCKKGCSFTANCPLQTVCVDDDSEAGFACRAPCSVRGTCASDEACYAEEHSLQGYICVPTKAGRAVVLGGWDGTVRQKTADSVNFQTLPELPVPIAHSAAAVAGEYIVLCGGWHGNEKSKNCYKINFNSPSNSWETMPSAPFVMSGHSALSIERSIIWFIVERNIFSFDAQNQMFSAFRLPYDAGRDHCSVFNGTHAYVIGAGNGRDEIWVNKRPRDGSDWRYVASMSGARYEHACLWYGSNIMITGGANGRSDVEIFSTETSKVWAGKNLLTGREDHQMMLLEGKPTVLGGWSNNKFWNTFESFSFRSNRWEKLSRTLISSKTHFSLVEL